MLSSSTLSDSSTSPIFYVDNIASYLIDDATNYYTTSYYHSPSPLIYNNEIDNFGNFITNHELSIIQQSMLAQNNNNSINIPDDSSILELDTKVDSSKSGDHEGEIINGIVEDNNGEMNHIITSSTTTTTTTANHPHVEKVKKRRSSNKDRHSKIRTAHGLRDRRMRLSLQVARPFFQLQDMLGYDKSSATVEWLLIQSKPAIDELLQSKLGSPPSGVTTTKCTTTSSNSDDGEVESTKIEEREGDSPKEKTILSSPKVEPNNKQKRKRTTKEERKVARERAKQRTLARMQRRGHSKEEGNIITTSYLTSTNYQQGFNISQNVPSYRIPTQQNMMGGPL